MTFNNNNNNNKQTVQVHCTLYVMYNSLYQNFRSEAKRENFSAPPPSEKSSLVARARLIFIKSTFKVIFLYFKRVLGNFGNPNSTPPPLCPLPQSSRGMGPGARGPPPVHNMDWTITVVTKGGSRLDDGFQL